MVPTRMDELWNIEQVFDALHKAGITNSIQMTRKWVRTGAISGGVMPKGERNRKEGWRVPQASVEAFIMEKKPYYQEFHRLQERMNEVVIELSSVRRRNVQLARMAEQTRRNQMQLESVSESVLRDIRVQKPWLQEEHVLFAQNVLKGSSMDLSPQQLNMLCEVLIKAAPDIIGGGIIQ